MSVTSESAQISGIDTTVEPWAGTLISADSHVIEPTSAWAGVLPPDFWPGEGKFFQERPGGSEPIERLEAMKTDGVSAEVLYPSLALKCFSIPDVELHEAACRAYNDWLMAYCSVDPDRLLGVGMIPTWDPDRAIAEMRRCSAGGLRGFLVWQTPHPDIPFTSDHYERIWDEAEAQGLPMSMHILTGFNYSKIVHGDGEATPVDLFRGSVSDKLHVVMNAVFDLMVGGAFERHPGMKMVMVENEMGWLPFYLDQMDYYFRRIGAKAELPVSTTPSDLFERQMFITFFRDPLAGKLLDTWGNFNCMWSNDYPHGNSTWPHSRQYVASSLAGLPADVLERVTHLTVEKLYGIDLS